ncbi:MAG: hypothetical protein ACTHN0_09440 [Aquihabitans sp.]
MSSTPEGGPAWAIRSRQVAERRVEAEVDGVPLWVECDDVRLTDHPEAWATAFSLPSARAGYGLRLDRPGDPDWAASAQRNVAMAAGWWGGMPQPTWVVPNSRLPRWLHRRPAPASGTGLCFTGGVDSFFSLLRRDQRPTCLVYVVGFDVPVDDRERAAEVVALVRDVARDQRTPALIVRTDLREHPRFASISWEHTHGAALAAIGHLLSATISTLVIPPSYAADRLVPWGSHPELDAGWSVPGRLEVVHGDASGHRLDRVLAIADDPLVQRHLRVCWQNVGSDLNCGSCEKCVRTMAMLAAAGTLDACTGFPGRSELPGRIDALRSVPAGIVPLWQDLLDVGLRPEERAAVAALVERSSGR